MLTCIDVKFIFDSVPLGFSSFSNILQIADVALRVVFLLFLLWFFFAIITPSSSCSFYSWNEWSVRHFYFHNQNNSAFSHGALTCKNAACLSPFPR